MNLDVDADNLDLTSTTLAGCRFTVTPNVTQQPQARFGRSGRSQGIEPVRFQKSVARDLWISRCNIIQNTRIPLNA